MVWLMVALAVCLGLAELVLSPDVANAARGRWPSLAASVQTTSPAVTEDRVFFSAAVNSDVHYLVYLPPGYQASNRKRYPVLYMLHGRGGNYREWADYGLFDTATRLINSGAIRPLIIVLPQGGQNYWVNHADNGPRWGDFVARDLVSEIDSHFRTQPQREKRAVGGVSMGGCGALQLGMNYNDVFAVVGAHSPAFRTRDTAPDYFGDQAWFDAHSPVPLFKAYPERARRLTLKIDMGEQDTWHGPAEAFHRQLADAQIAHVWQSRTGGHSGEYWSRYVEEYLRYYSAALAKPSP